MHTSLLPYRKHVSSLLAHAHMEIGAQILLGVFCPSQGIRTVSIDSFWGDLLWELAAETLEDYFLPMSSLTLVSQTS